MSDISLLLPDIELLIKAYEEGTTRDSFKPSSNLNKVAVASKTLYYEPLSDLEYNLKSRVLGTSTHAQTLGVLGGEYLPQEVEDSFINDIERGVAEEYEEFKNAFKDERYAENTIVNEEGKDRDRNGNKIEFWEYKNLDKNTLLNENGDINYSSFLDRDTEEVKFRRKISNKAEGKAGINITKGLDKYFGWDDGKVKIGEKDFNFGIEKCFNCIIKIDLNYVMPALEFVFDFSKIINDIKTMLQQIDKDLNPLEIYNKLCQFKLAFTDNLICPANLKGLNILLPSLFLKYSFDMIKIRIDPSMILGNIISGVVKGLVSIVENIPKIVIPFADCIINATRSTFGYLREIVKSISSIVNQSLDIANRIAVAMHKTVLNFIDFFGGDLDTLEKEKENLQKELAEIQADYLALDFKDLKIEKELLELSEFTERVNRFATYLFSLAPVEPALSYNSALDLFSTWRGVDGKLISILEKYARLSEKDRNVLLKKEEREKLKASQEKIKKIIDQQNERIKSRGNRETLENKMAKNRMSIEAVLEGGESIGVVNPSKHGLQGKYGIKANTKPPHKFGYNSNNNRGAADNFSFDEWILGKYGVDLNQRYTEYEYEWITKSKEWFKFKPLLDTLSSVEKAIIKPVEEFKKWILELTNGLVLLFKNFDRFLGEHTAMQFKILGEIQELLHLIRLYRLINELWKNGFKNCNEAKTNPNLFKSLIEESIKENNKNNKVEFGDSQDALVIKDKTSDKILEKINLKECSEVIKKIEVKEQNLDTIYEAVKNGYYNY